MFWSENQKGGTAAPSANHFIGLSIFFLQAKKFAHADICEVCGYSHVEFAKGYEGPVTS